MSQKLVNVLQSGKHTTANDRFTVKQLPKVEVIESEKKERSQTSVCLAVVKWIITIIMFCVTLFCLVASKFTLVALGQRLHNANLKTQSPSCKTEKNHESDTAFVMVMLALMIPQLIGFIRAVRNSAFSTKESWPSKLAIFYGMLSAVLEVTGITVFAFLVISSTGDFGKAIVLMNGIFVIPIVLQMYGECTSRNSAAERNFDDSSYVSFKNENNKSPFSYLRQFLLIFAFLCVIGGLIFAAVKGGSITNVVIYIISMVCLSIAWSSKLFYLQTKSSIKNQVENLGDIDTSHASMTNMRIKTARHRMTLISSVFKLILVFFVSLALNHFFNITCNKNPFESLANGFKYFGYHNVEMTAMFLVQVACSFVGYVMCLLACSMNLQKICFALPLILSTPVAFALTLSSSCSYLINYHCVKDNSPFWQVAVIGILLWLSQLLSLGLQSFKAQQFLMAQEEMLFWLPAYNSCFLEQHILLNRKNEVVDETYVNYHEMVKNSHIYICTTMYHEADYEMEQLLQSLAKIDQARKESGRQFEAHVFFDDGARGDVVKLYALQLLSLLKDTMGIEPGKAFKLETPYGLQLKWALPHGMPFVLHLKDKIKVKSKKRWSQVMYMSYVLDFKQDKVNDDLTYILATDADVKFKPNDVMALMDFMSRNPDVGAVCGRTHPLGSGPMVWYQIFDYAIGHWLLKVANHVYGSVLCSPGCFSVYRAKAIRDVLPLYSTSVDCAMDFLMKDMGEDRWFCTLLVEAGWKLEYCATAENSTYCPDTFDEFFKQRRRWGPSTFANSIVVVNEHAMIRENNDAITFFFIIYQLILMVSSIIGPSTVLLVIAGGLEYAFPHVFNLVVVLVVLVLVTLLFTIICVYCSQDTQLKWAKLLTFAFAIVMSITIVGIILQTVDDISGYVDPPLKDVTTTPHPFNVTHSTPVPTYVEQPYIFNPSTWYLLTITSIFVITAFLHGMEGLYLIHGIWYLLCLPSGYLLLTIYSVANLTDRSWGTREGKTQGSDETDSTLQDKFIKYFKYICWCCVPPHLRIKEQTEESAVKSQNHEVAESQNTYQDDHSDESSTSSSEVANDDVIDGESTDQLLDIPPPMSPQPKKSAMKKGVLKRYPSADELDGKSPRGSSSLFRFPGEDKAVKFSSRLPHLHAATPVEEWLPKDYQCYVVNFKEHGYDNVSFIAGIIKEKDLIKMGITNRGHRKKLMSAIESLPPEEFFQEVPENVEEWLIKLGLDEHWPKFSSNSYTEPRDLADIKYMSNDTISTIFDIRKEAHLKKLTMATSVLQYPTKAQTRIREARKAIMSEPTKSLKLHNADDGEEWEFWEELREICLLPEQAAFNQSGELVEKLGDLRDTTLLVLTVSNVLWLTFMVTIMEQTRLELLGTSFASLAFLIVYGVVLIMQFLSMIWHRMETAVHFIARAPFKPGHFRSNWAWRDADLPPPPDPALLEEIRRKKRKRSDESLSSERRHRSFTNDVNEPLLHEEERRTTFS